MVRIIAKQRIPYGKRRYEIGEEIPDVSDKDARLLVKIGKAEFVGASSPTDLPAAAMAPVATAAPAPVEEAAPEADVDPRTDTRDVQATGQTGRAAPSRSSRQGRRQKGKN